MGLETETETETFRDVYRQVLATFAHFFSETKFFDTDTETLKKNDRVLETETETFECD